MPRPLRTLLKADRGTALRAFLALGAVASYALAFIPPYSTTDLGVVVLAAGPVLVAGWLLGFWGGLGAALLSFPLNAFLLNVTGQADWGLLSRPGALQGAVLVLILGVVVGGLRDIARQMQRDAQARADTEAAAQETNTRYRMVAESASDPIVTLDDALRVLYANPAAARVAGLKRVDLEAMRFDALLDLRDDADVAERLRAHLRSLDADSPNPRPLTLTLLRADGERVEVEASFGPSVRGDLLLYTGVLRNVTERREQEQALMTARNEAVRANQAKSEFISRMSHELRTPLNAILGFAGLMEPSSLSEEDQDSLQQIRYAGRHLLGLVDEVLDIARIEAGRLALSPEPLSLADATAQAWDLLRPRARERDVRLEVGPGLEQVPPVVADAQRLRQVMLNLLSNAVKYNREGGAVRVHAERKDSGVRVRIEDDGPGVAAEHVERLFTPFDRLGAERSGVEGTGVGLSLSRTLVRAMGGEMDYDADSAAFWFTLPVAPTVLEDAPHAAPAPAAGAPVLAIVADPLNQRLIERLLADSGSRVLGAMQAGMGLELAAQHGPGAVLVDTELPDMAAPELLRRLRALLDDRTPLVAIVTAEDVEEEAELRRAGATAVLTQPLDAGLLAQVTSAADGSLAVKPS